MHKCFHIIIGLLLIGTVGCKDKPSDGLVDNFDKEAMLTNMAENVIEPAYTVWHEKIVELNEKATEFSNNPSEIALDEVQDAFLEAYKSWNRCSVYEFGPAADKSLRLKVNVFPADTSQIESNVINNGIDFGTPANAEAIGFAAMDYLLFSMESELLIDANRRGHLLSQIEWVSNLSSDVNSSWIDYRSDFTSNTNSSAGSSLSNLVNEINYEFELFKNARIGIPMGKKTLGITQVSKLEAFYSNESEVIALENLIGIRNAFSGGSGLGLDDYLNDLNAKKDGSKLSELIIEAFDDIETDIKQVDLDVAIVNDPSSLEPMYSHIEQLVVLLKVDMPSQLGVQITYQDNDGD